MILFKPEHVAPIVEGRKTQTRRVGMRRWRDGAIHQARTLMLDKSSTFARLEILSVGRERLQDITEADARAEGYDTRVEFKIAWDVINGAGSWTLNPTVWVVRFRLWERF